MKRALCLLLTALVLGCATTDKAIFRETANQNVLDLGSCRIYIDKRFVKVGDIQRQGSSENIDNSAGSNYTTRGYIFADSSDGKNRIARGFVIYDINLTNPNHSYLGEPSFDKYKASMIETGMTDRIGTRSAYCVKNSRGVPADIVNAMTSKGFFIDKDFKSGVEILFRKYAGRSRQVDIWYIEAVDASQSKTVFENAVHFIRFEM